MLQSTRLGFLAALLIAFSASAQAQTAEQANLAWSFEKGSKNSYVLDWVLDLGQSVKTDQQDMPLGTISVKVSYTLEQEITAVEGGVATVKAIFKTVKGETGMMMMGMPGPVDTYDSTKEGGSELLSSLSKCLGESITFKMDSRGKVSEVSGGQAVGEKIMAALQDAMANQQGGQQQGPMAGAGAAQTVPLTLLAFEDGSVESALNMVCQVLPTEAGAKTWQIDHAQRSKIGGMKWTGKYRLGEAAEGATTITFKNLGDVELNKEEGGNDAPGLAQMVKDLKVVDSEVSGSSKFGAGHVIQSEVDFKADTQGTAPEMIKQRLEMMLGPQKGDMKLGVQYKLKLNYTRAKAKQSDF